VTADVDPPELAALLDYAERPRTDDWSLRAALTRYAQGQPQRVGDLLELVRRIDFAVRPHLKAVERDGPTYWQAVQSGGRDGDLAVALLRAMAEIDRLGDVLATWASDPRSAPRPDAAVDAVIAEVSAGLERLGVPREERPGRPPPGRRRG
jgi:hypothetical protein